MTHLSLEILLLHALILVTILPKSGLSRFSDSEEWREMENTIPTTLHPEQAGQKAAVLPKKLFTRRVLHQLSFWCQKMQFYCSNFPLLPTISQLCCYIGKHEKAKGLDYISKGRNVGSAARSSFKFSRQSWTIGENHTYSGIIRNII